MSAHTTAAPSWAKRSAEARPTPEPAPVTTVTLSFSNTLRHAPSWSDSPVAPAGHFWRRPRADHRTETYPGAGGSAGVNRYSFSAFPRSSLYWVSAGRWPITFLTAVMQLGHVESECG